ncbi:MULTISPECIES: pirin family protein [Clostridium]|jgi:redox-sensitive bicupin YhaK (pirin superfamily)|uniref:Pirin family protein n=3 Tax=Clostridium TaxID=1485 RepID=A0AAV3VYF1_9CLOT|nr:MULTISPECIES: pirin family protein [Clostridium]ALB45765.1 pirin family protein [Clostridium beijerinckii NRRL B-598]AVK47118.1 pirin [Clostridium sp. MF28]MBC2456499.1 pirin family protein [Clostridium beijerinckii]MBC2473836.1 pirin family protein [Clostridium beijerinckii]MCI1578733.1 pirin family protein [Clostridium beijerinckii]
MLRVIDSGNMGSSNLGWLRSKFHFSFAEYYNPHNIKFGVLRVINDDLVESNTGFDTHPHRNMEIISYVVNGELTHGDSMGNKNTITRGHVQYMSAGTGVYHSEHNLGKDELRFLQIWIFPDKEDYKPNYGDYRFDWSDRQNKWLHMVSSKNGNAPIKINQDINVYSLELDKGKEINFQVNEGRQAYLVQIEGGAIINDIELNNRDGMEIVEEDILIKAKKTSHILILEMKKEN